MEVWEFLEGFEGKYQVSNLGRMRSLDREVVQKASQGGGLSIRQLKGQILKQRLNTVGYMKIRICGKNSVPVDLIVHRAVAKAFIPNPDNKPQVNHINGIKTDNRVENLEWVTCSENQRHAHSTSLISYQFGEQHHNTKLTEEDVLFIKTHYKYRDPIWNTTTLSKKYGVSLQTILNIVNGKVWDRVKRENVQRLAEKRRAERLEIEGILRDGDIVCSMR